ncbi:glutamine-hydrolyzing GMP synthase [Coxiella endosymbiont of Amblyomma nuttalli]|uniref:glutamine-hydrolyzing GMP synthase n=1 Tax=Coxiella endosymbiont of Amblyomma nuttalli TaxID=2749996 RepID=UPI001BAC2570|nr:glutamine-hydrolyzing GMP synthase [Coxiella endosymbiont of Amblyomma nuttalli]QTS83862.1 GMP synthase [glutamine-hydrolyzing] [Coxiella endosymbiont of Amblyomma nuttalli]
MFNNIYQHRILILDFGSQYTQLIMRRVREIGVYCELMPCDIDAKTIRNFSPNGIILSGGSETVTMNHTMRAPMIVFEIGCPVLGICYGMQTMAYQLGGKVETATKAEFGHAELRILNPILLFEGIKNHISPDGTPLLDVWMSHGDIVTVLPPDFETVASTDNSPFAAIVNFERKFFGLQFHPEVTHTSQGHLILEHFVSNICRCEFNWAKKNIIGNYVRDIQKKIGKGRVIVGLSGGIDSAVTAVLIHRAIGDRLVCVLVDTGLLRLHDTEEILGIFKKYMDIKIIHIDAKARFMQALRGIVDPEKKRNIIGKQFISVFETEAKKLGINWLGQGTIYPDVIESAKTKTGTGHVIKTHHNVVELPLTTDLQLIEPLRELFKDEVRELGLALGLPRDVIYRHPFPGPGLAIRILGEVTPEYVDILQRADAIFIQELKKYDYYHNLNQAFAVFIPVKTVGIKGDARHYGYIVALRAVKTIDFMTAQLAELPCDFLSKVVRRILNEIKEISRVVYDITDKPPATIEWE